LQLSLMTYERSSRRRSGSRSRDREAMQILWSVRLFVGRSSDIDTAELVRAPRPAAGLGKAVLPTQEQLLARHAPGGAGGRGRRGSADGGASSLKLKPKATNRAQRTWALGVGKGGSDAKPQGAPPRFGPADVFVGIICGRKRHKRNFCGQRRCQRIWLADINKGRSAE
jgi:hypothetical protein